MKHEEILPDISYKQSSDISNLFFLDRQTDTNDFLLYALRDSSVFIFTTDNSLRYIKTLNSGILFNDRNIIGSTDYDLLSAEEAKKFFENKSKVLMTGKSLKYEDCLKVGLKTFYLEIKLDPIIGIKNNITGLCGIVIDTTKKKLAEDKLKKTIKALDRYIKEFEQLSYVASHDLQEPLRAIGSFTQLLEIRYKDKLDEAANKYIHYTVEGVNRMQSLLNDLLDYTRLPHQSRPFKSFDCSIIMDIVLNNLDSKISESRAIIRSDVLPSIVADESQILQLFQNLIQNAIKFTRNGVPEIEIRCEQLEFEWLFSVKDNGAGIKKEYHEKIFTIFQRLNDRDEFEGTGIGLALCKKIVEHHGGQIWVESSLGKGSTFYFTIPFRGE